MMLSKIANYFKDIKTIALGISAIVIGFPTFLVYKEIIVSYFYSHFDIVMIASIVLLLMALVVTHKTIDKKEKELNSKLNSVKNELSVDIMQVTETMKAFHNESRVSHIKAEVDRMYHNFANVESITEHTMSYLIDLNKNRIKYKINSFTERRIEKLLELEVQG
jgi:ABC-type bacteriocin/lantibiotic exporter with double-glycine peptidase domain